MRKALIIEGRVYTVEQHDPWPPMSPTLTWVECDDTVLQGDSYDAETGVFSHPAPPPLTVADYSAAVQAHLDAAARAMGYDDIGSAVTYADEPAVPKFQTEGQSMRAWRSLVWAACYQIMADVQQSVRPAPSIDALIAELPTL